MGRLCEDMSDNNALKSTYGGSVKYEILNFIAQKFSKFQN